MDQLKSKYAILIVDDEPLIRKSLFEILKIEGYNCHMVASAEEAQDVLGQKLFDVVITDLQLPKMNGLGLLDWIKRILSQQKSSSLRDMEISKPPSRP